MSAILCINIISIILAVIGIIIIICRQCNSTNNKNNFGDPPGRQRQITQQELGLDRGWGSFWCNDSITSNNSEPNCYLNGHRGTTASALSYGVEFSP
jgi:hypothetical protein